jgi:hypothetical protein
MRRSFWQPYTVIDPLIPCPSCGYSLVGLESGASNCPECGRELTPNDRVAEYRFHSVWHSVLEGPFLAGVIGLVMVISLAVGKTWSFDPLEMVFFLSGIAWLSASIVQWTSVFSAGVHTRRLRPGLHRTEHLVRLGYVAGGTVIVTIGPVVGILLINSWN